MKNTTRLTLALCASLSAAPATAADDLWEIYQLALANDPAYQVAIINHEANKVDLPLAETAFRPSVTATAQLGRDRSDRTGSTITSDDHNANLNLNLPIYDRASRVNIDQAETSVSVSELELMDARQDLILRVADRYFNLLAGQDALEVALVEKVAIKRQLDLSDERLQVGLGTLTDLYDARARFKQAEANEIQAQNKINNDIALLKEIIGITPEPLVPLKPDAPLDPPVPNVVDAWIERATEGNLALRAQQLNLEIAGDEIEFQRLSRYPVLSVDGNYRWNDTGSNSFGIDDSSSTSVALQLAFPLYQGGAVELRTRQAGLRYNQTEQFLEQVRRAASADATSAYLDVTSGISQVEALDDAITAGESALEAKEEGFNAGLTTNLDVLDAQRDLSQSRTDYLRARYTFILSVLALERAVGDLNEDDVRRVNSWLATQ